MDEAELQRAFESAIQAHRAGRLDEAELLYGQILRERPGHVDALQMLGMLAQQRGRGVEAVELLGTAVSLSPQSAACHYNYAKVLADNDRSADAIAHYRQALVLQPDFAPAWNNLGNLLNASGEIDAAIDVYRRCLGLKPDHVEAHYNLGTALRSQGNWEESAAELRQALSLRPNYPDACNNLGLALGELDRLDEAIATYRQGLALQPDHIGLNSNLGAAMRTAGQIPEAIAAFRKASARHSDSRAASNLLYTLLHDPSYEPAALAEDHRQWNRIYALSLRAEIFAHDNDRSPDRQLRIGYVSPDLGNHVVGRFVAPLLANHNHGDFEIFCYHDAAGSDPVAEQNRLHADRWRVVARESDRKIAQLIRDDHIDILVDLAMHTSNNRLLVFARKPAPVQVSYLAYPGSTGLETMHWRLTDPYLEPTASSSGPQREQAGLEKPFWLPHTFWCYAKPAEAAEVQPPPAMTSGLVTFGCLNNFAKMSEPILGAWIRILRQTPGSRLLLHARGGSHRQRLAARMQHEGIDPHRLVFVGFQPLADYFRQYHQIDVALDTFPYAGGTTTCDALWMGVPVVSLAGKTPISRGGASILSNIGLTELLAGDLDEYVSIATKLAADIPRLAMLRSEARARMRGSPLMDAPQFARDLEAAYRRMWHRWCWAEKL
jgi:protein O-GlcNAc transferase